MDLIQSAVLYSVMTLVSTYLVAFAYKNVQFVLKHKYVYFSSERVMHCSVVGCLKDHLCLCWFQ